MDLLFETDSVIIPLIDVQHAEKSYDHKKVYNGLIVITRHTRWNAEADYWANNIFVGKDDVEEFLKRWRAYLNDRVDNHSLGLVYAPNVPDCFKKDGD